MARGLNKAMLIGNVGRDPEVRDTKTGKKVANFSVATSEKWNDHEITTWHNIVCWEKTAEIVERYVHKGDRIYVEGRISHREYEGKDGGKRTVSEIVASQVLLLGWGKEAAAPKTTTSHIDAAINGDASLDPIAEEDDLPF